MSGVFSILECVALVASQNIENDHHIKCCVDFLFLQFVYPYFFFMPAQYFQIVKLLTNIFACDL